MYVAHDLCRANSADRRAAVPSHTPGPSEATPLADGTSRGVCTRRRVELRRVVTLPLHTPFQPAQRRYPRTDRRSLVHSRRSILAANCQAAKLPRSWVSTCARAAAAELLQPKTCKTGPGGGSSDERALVPWPGRAELERACPPSVSDEAGTHVVAWDQPRLRERGRMPVVAGREDVRGGPRRKRLAGVEASERSPSYALARHMPLGCLVSWQLAEHGSEGPEHVPRAPPLTSLSS
jgi:hypothetical protein